MALFFAIVVTVLTAGFSISLFMRLKEDCFDEKQLKVIRDQLRYVLVCGVLDSAFCWLNFYLWNYALPYNPILPVGLTVITILLFLGLLFMYGFAPSRKSVRQQNQYVQNKKKLDDFLSGYAVDKTITIGRTVFAACLEKQSILIYYDITASSFELFYRAIPFSSLTGCELIEDQTTIFSGGVGRAVVGAAVAGAVGAVVGAATRKSENVTTQMSIHIYTKDVLNPLYEIPVIDHQIPRSSDEYKELLHKAQKICATVDAITKQV